MDPHAAAVDLIPSVLTASRQKRAPPYPAKKKATLKQPGQAWTCSLHVAGTGAKGFTLRFFQSDSYRRAAALFLGTEQAHSMAVEGPAEATAPSSPDIAGLTYSQATMRPTEPPTPRMAPRFPSAADCREGVGLSRGGARLWTLLHRLAVDVGKAREYGAVPHAVTFHLPACAIALYLGYTERHLSRLADELTEKGLLAGGAHAQSVMGRSLWDGTLWKVRTLPGHAPRVTADEWKHEWRPDFAADYYGKNGAQAEMSGLLAEQGQTEKAYAALLRRAAVSGDKKAPLPSSPDNSRNADLDSIAADLPGLLHVHPKNRHAAVTDLASRLTRALTEPERFKQWCSELYAALNAENQLRPALRSMADELRKFGAELRQGEGEHLRSAGAVLAVRLKTAAT